MVQTSKGKDNAYRDMLLNSFKRGISSLRTEIETYKDESSIWKTAEGITNSGGNLCLHLVGNLNHFIGANLGHTGFVRERDLEFSERDIPAADLVARINDVEAVIVKTLESLSDESLGEDYPEVLFGEQMDSGTVLAYMSGHLSYHLGQLNYHRRLLDR